MNKIEKKIKVIFMASIDIYKKLLYNSHRVLIEGVKYHADQPCLLGKTFLRLERDFDKHVVYCRDEPNAQEFLHEHQNVREYFQVYVDKKII